MLMHAQLHTLLSHLTMNAGASRQDSRGISHHEHGDGGVEGHEGVRSYEQVEQPRGLPQALQVVREPGDEQRQREEGGTPELSTCAASGGSALASIGSSSASSSMTASRLGLRRHLGQR